MKSHTTQTKINANDVITDRILTLLEKGVAPWRKPWKVAEQMPRNLISGKPYRGINIFMLHAFDYASPFWLTFKQTQELGGRVKKGEKSAPCVFWKKYEVEENGSKRDAFVLRFYHLFNLAQVENIKQTEPTTPATTTPPTPAAQIVEQMQNRPQIKFGFRRCSYSPSFDEIHMADRETFTTEEEFYATLFHELTHSTGHDSRLGRFDKEKPVSFGDEEYSKEELIAEMGSAFLCGEAGIFNHVQNNSTAYLAGWIKALKNDKTMLICAAAKAQKAADYILNGTAPTV